MAASASRQQFKLLGLWNASLFREASGGELFAPPAVEHGRVGHGCTIASARRVGAVRIGGTISPVHKDCWAAHGEASTAQGHADRPAAEQRDEADEGRLEAERSMVGGSCHGVAATKNHGGVVRPSQLIASVRRLLEG